MAAIFPAGSPREPIASLAGPLRRQLRLKNCRCHVRHIFLTFPLFSALSLSFSFSIPRGTGPRGGAPRRARTFSLLPPRLFYIALSLSPKERERESLSFLSLLPCLFFILQNLRLSLFLGDANVLAPSRAFQGTARFSHPLLLSNPLPVGERAENSGCASRVMHRPSAL